MKIEHKNGVVSSMDAGLFGIILLLQNIEVVGVANSIESIDLLNANKSSVSTTFLPVRNFSSKFGSKIRNADEINISSRKLAVDGYLNTSFNICIKRGNNLNG